MTMTDDQLIQLFNSMAPGVACSQTADASVCPACEAAHDWLCGHRDLLAYILAWGSQRKIHCLIAGGSQEIAAIEFATTCVMFGRAMAQAEMLEHMAEVAPENHGN